MRPTCTFHVFRSEFHVIGVILVAMTTIAKGNWPSVINLHGVYPNLGISFWSSLYLIQLRKVYLYIHNSMFDKNVMQSYIGCMTFWPLALPLLSLWWFIISSRLILIPCRMPFESCLCHFVGEWELFFGIHVHFKELYVFGIKLVTMATIVKGYWPSVIIWEVFTPTLWTFFGLI